MHLNRPVKEHHLEEICPCKTLHHQQIFLFYCIELPAAIYKYTKPN